MYRILLNMNYIIQKAYYQEFLRNTNVTLEDPKLSFAELCYTNDVLALQIHSPRKTLLSCHMDTILTAKAYLLGMKHFKSFRCNAADFDFFDEMSSIPVFCCAKRSALIPISMDQQTILKCGERTCKEIPAQRSFGEWIRENHEESLLRCRHPNNTSLSYFRNILVA